MVSSNSSRWSRLAEPTAAELERAAGGDRQALEALVERYQGMVYSIALSVLGTPDDAEDAAQETFLRLCRRLGQFRGEASFATWLHRLTVNVAVDALRRRRRGGERYELADALAGAAPANDAEGAALKHLDAVALATALRELPGDYRLPVVLRDVQGLEYAEIAALTGRPLGTVKAMVHRGRGALRLRLRAAGALGEES